jgi:hypothetical protein
MSYRLIYAFGFLLIFTLFACQKQIDWKTIHSDKFYISFSCPPNAIIREYNRDSSRHSLYISIPYQKRDPFWIPYPRRDTNLIYIDISSTQLDFDSAALLHEYRTDGNNWFMHANPFSGPDVVATTIKGDGWIGLKVNQSFGQFTELGYASIGEESLLFLFFRRVYKPNVVFDISYDSTAVVDVRRIISSINISN